MGLVAQVDSQWLFFGQRPLNPAGLAPCCRESLQLAVLALPVGTARYGFLPVPFLLGQQFHEMRLGSYHAARKSSAFCVDVLLSTLALLAESSSMGCLAFFLGF